VLPDDQPATLDDVLEVVRGIGRVLMSVDANLYEIVKLLREDNGEEEADT
jgi:hypothetical protein